MTRIRLDPKDRKQQMLEAGLVLLRQYGVKALTRVAIANETGTTDGLVNRYFGNRDRMREEIIITGIRRNDATVLAQAIKSGAYKFEDVSPKLMREAQALVPQLA